MIKLLEKMLSDNGLLWWGNFLCSCVGAFIVFWPGYNEVFFKWLGVALVLMGIIYFGHKMITWKWLELIYPFVTVGTIILGVIALFK